MTQSTGRVVLVAEGDRLLKHRVKRAAASGTLGRIRGSLSSLKGTNPG